MAEIRRLGPDDWQMARDVRLQALTEAPYAFGSTYAAECELEEMQWRERIVSHAWFVAVEGEYPIGVVVSTHETVRDVYSMWAHPDARGTAVATQLVKAVADLARHDGATGLRLWVADGNDRAARFYERLGFVPTGERAPLPSNPAVSESQLRLDLPRS